MNKNQFISFLIFLGAAVLFVYALMKFNEHLPIYAALIPVVVLAVLIHMIFYEKLFLLCANDPDERPVNATHIVKNCMLMNAISASLVMIALGMLVYTSSTA